MPVPDTDRILNAAQIEATYLPRDEYVPGSGGSPTPIIGIADDGSLYVDIAGVPGGGSIAVADDGSLYATGV